MVGGIGQAWCQKVGNGERERTEQREKILAEPAHDEAVIPD